MLKNAILSSIIFVLISTAVSTDSVQDYLNSFHLIQKINTTLYRENISKGHNDFNEALDKIGSICDEESFKTVIKLLQKSAKFKYDPSYMALGTIYQSKHLHGSVFYGVKGTPEDLTLAIKYLTRAANRGSSEAQNAIGELYLHEANIYDPSLRIKFRDVEDDKNIIKIPDMTNAIHWFEKAAKNGNPAAQGTLSDLYKLGIGIPQDYVLAYVWSNISITSQSKYNEMMHKEIGRGLMNVSMKDRDELYNILTAEQKNCAIKLIAEYNKKYVIRSSSFDLECRDAKNIVLAHNIKVLIEITDLLLKDYK